MAASATFQLPTYRANTGLSVSRDVIEVAERDYRYVLKSIAAQEIAEQRSLGNKPSNIIVDGRGNKSIDEVKYSIFAYFFDASSLIQAMSGAKQMMMAYARRDSGKTLGAAQFYQKQGKTGAIQEIGSLNPSTMNISTDLFLAYPVAHTRKWQWFAKTGARMTRLSRSAVNRRKQAKVRVAKSIFERVISNLRSRYPRVDFIYTYIPVMNLNSKYKTAVDRIPAIKVRTKLKGRV